MSHQLTAEEIEHLTGAKFATKQIEALKASGIPFFVNAKRRPVTTWEAVNHTLIGNAAITEKGDGFNLSGAL